MRPEGHRELLTEFWGLRIEVTLPGQLASCIGHSSCPPCLCGHACWASCGVRSAGSWGRSPRPPQPPRLQSLPCLNAAPGPGSAVPNISTTLTLIPTLVGTFTLLSAKQCPLAAPALEHFLGARPDAEVSTAGPARGAHRPGL